MVKVIGVDFGTRSVRASIVDSRDGLIATDASGYSVWQVKSDPDFATQSHADHMSALAIVVKGVLRMAKVSGEEIKAIALDTTGSTVIMVDEHLQPIDDYYLWCDHRAKAEAEEFSEAAKDYCLEAIEWCGGTYSSEWGFAKLLHWLRRNSSSRRGFASALEHCDMVAATLCGVSNPRDVKRSICAMGHKWMWDAKLGGLPPQDFLTKVDPQFEGIREKLSGEYLTSENLAGHLSPHWAEKLALQPGIPIPVGAFDAHWDAIGAGVGLGDMVNVIGTSTCIIGTTDNQTLVPGLCGIVQGSVHPHHFGIEAGLSAVGDIFSAIAKRANTTVDQLALGLEKYSAGQTGLLRMVWDNGDRTVLVNPLLNGMTLGWTLNTTPQEELMAAVEGTAFHTKIIFDRMIEHGVEIKRTINAGGIGQRSKDLNQIYANVLGRPIYALNAPAVGLGAGIFALLAAGAFKTVEEAQAQLCPPLKRFEPNATEHQTYAELYEIYRTLYFAFGNRSNSPFGHVMPRLISLREKFSKQLH